MQSDFEQYAGEIRDGLTADAANPPPLLDTISAADLQRANLPPVRFVVDALISHGLSIIASPPKFGKSWLVLYLCLCVAAGRAFLGYQTNKCRVLYLALEDSKHRLKSRMDALLAGQAAPQGFDFAINAHALDNGLLDELDGYLKENPTTGLIVIDTLQKVRGAVHGREGAYAADYREMATLKSFADAHNIALLLVHHLRKMGDDGDPFARISGTNGIFGAADTAIVLTREKRGDENTTMSIVGRDVESAEIVLRFDKQSGRWVNIGSAEDVAEQRARDEYLNNPLVETVKKLLEQSADHRWSGTASDLMAAGQFMAQAYLAPNTKALGKAISSMERLMLDYDGILHTTTGNGNAGRKHHFSYQDAPEFTELTDADQEELPFS